jgi:hypothetical protein
MAVTPSQLGRAELLALAKTVTGAPAGMKAPRSGLGKAPKSPLTLRMEALRASCAPAAAAAAPSGAPRRHTSNAGKRPRCDHDRGRGRSDRRAVGCRELSTTEAAVPLAARADRRSPLNEAELDVVRQILLEAERATFGRHHLDRLLQADHRRHFLPLPAVLRAYAVVLPRAGYSTADDTRFYRFLIELSVDTTRDWWPKFEACCRGARAGLPRNPSRKHALAAKSSTDSALGVRERRRIEPVLQEMQVQVPAQVQRRQRRQQRVDRAAACAHCGRRKLSSALRDWHEASVERQRRTRQHHVIERAAAVIVHSPQRKRPSTSSRWIRAAVFAAWSRVATGERGRRWALAIELDRRSHQARYRPTWARWKRWQALHRWSLAERSTMIGAERLELVDVATSPMVQQRLTPPAPAQRVERTGRMSVSAEWLEQAVEASSASVKPSSPVGEAPSGEPSAAVGVQPAEHSVAAVEEQRADQTIASQTAAEVRAEPREATIYADGSSDGGAAQQENSAAGVGDALARIPRKDAAEHDDIPRAVQPQRLPEASMQSTQFNQSLDIDTTADLARLFMPIKRHIDRDLDPAAIQPPTQLPQQQPPAVVHAQEAPSVHTAMADTATTTAVAPPAATDDDDEEGKAAPGSSSEAVEQSVSAVHMAELEEAMTARAEADQRAQAAEEDAARAALQVAKSEESAASAAAKAAAEAGALNATLEAEYEALSGALASERKDRERRDEETAAMLQAQAALKAAALANESVAVTALTEAAAAHEAAEVEATSRAAALAAQTEALSSKVATMQAEADAAMAEVTMEREAARAAAAKAQTDAEAMQAKVAAAERSLRGEASASASVAARYDSLLAEHGKIATSVAAQAAVEACEMRAEMDQSQQKLRYEADAANARLKAKYETMLEEQTRIAADAERKLAAERARQLQEEQQVRQEQEHQQEAHQVQESSESEAAADAVESFEDAVDGSAEPLLVSAHGSPESMSSSGSSSVNASFHSADASEVSGSGRKDDSAVGVGEALGMMREVRAQRKSDMGALVDEPAEPDESADSGADSSIGSINNTADLAKMFAKTTAPIIRTASNLGATVSAPELHAHQQQQQQQQMARTSESNASEGASHPSTPTKTARRSPHHLQRRSPASSSASSSESPTRWLVAAVERASPGRSSSSSATSGGKRSPSPEMQNAEGVEEMGADPTGGELARSLSESFDHIAATDTPPPATEAAASTSECEVVSGASSNGKGKAPALGERDLNSPWVREASKRAFNSPKRLANVTAKSSSSLPQEPTTPERRALTQTVAALQIFADGATIDHPDHDLQVRTIEPPCSSSSSSSSQKDGIGRGGATDGKDEEDRVNGSAPLVLVTNTSSSTNGARVVGRFSPGARAVAAAATAASARKRSEDFFAAFAGRGTTPNSAARISLDSTTPTHRPLLQPPPSDPLDENAHGSSRRSSSRSSRSSSNSRRDGNSSVSSPGLGDDADGGVRSAKRVAMLPIKVKTLDGAAFVVRVPADSTVGHVKHAIHSRHGTSPPQQRLTTSDGLHLVDDSRLLAEYGIERSPEKEQQLLLVKRLGILSQLPSPPPASTAGIGADADADAAANGAASPFSPADHAQHSGSSSSSSPGGCSSSDGFGTPIIISSTGGGGALAVSSSSEQLSGLAEKLHGALDELAAEFLEDPGADLGGTRTRTDHQPQPQASALQLQDEDEEGRELSLSTVEVSLASSDSGWSPASVSLHPPSYPPTNADADAVSEAQSLSFSSTISSPLQMEARSGAAHAADAAHPDTTTTRSAITTGEMSGAAGASRPSSGLFFRRSQEQQQADQQQEEEQAETAAQGAEVEAVDSAFVSPRRAPLLLLGGRGGAQQQQQQLLQQQQTVRLGQDGSPAESSSSSDSFGF